MGHTFNINLDWKRTKDFSYEQYNRNHSITFGGQQTLKSSASTEFLGDADLANPEELLVSALASCHMLTLLAIAAKSGYVIDTYHDQASAMLEKNEEGKLAIISINLKPKIEWKGEKTPSAEQLKSLHDKAHRNCFIANSIKAKVNIESTGGIA